MKNEIYKDFFFSVFFESLPEYSNFVNSEVASEKLYHGISETTLPWLKNLVLGLWKWISLAPCEGIVVLRHTLLVHYFFPFASNPANGLLHLLGCLKCLLYNLTALHNLLMRIDSLFTAWVEIWGLSIFY